MTDIFHEAVASVLACPSCQGSLGPGKAPEALHCVACERVYPILDGIPILLPEGSNLQQEEKNGRDRIARNYIHTDKSRIMAEIARHHCAAVMQHYANKFCNEFTEADWICDIGIGWGWHWSGLTNKHKIIGVDMSIGNLRVAKNLMGPENANLLLICADAAALPFKDRVFSGIWSVQVFQHFPEEVLSRAKLELDRVLKDHYLIEIYNLNAPIFNRMIYFLLRKHFHKYGKSANMVLNRFSDKEWSEIFADFRQHTAKISVNYSELFFHPDLRCTPRRYPMALELFLVNLSAGLARIFARQVQLRILSA